MPLSVLFTTSLLFYAKLLLPTETNCVSKWDCVEEATLWKAGRFGSPKQNNIVAYVRVTFLFIFLKFIEFTAPLFQVKKLSFFTFFFQGLVLFFKTID